jgi:hypothetical protein
LCLGVELIEAAVRVVAQVELEVRDADRQAQQWRVGWLVCATGSKHGHQGEDDPPTHTHLI